MKRFVEGIDRSQSTCFPATLDEFIAEDNPVRALDAFVETLELGALGFDRVNPKATGRPPYHPAVLLKLYLYGYQNQIQTSRRLEKECQRNVEVMWLIGCRMPDHKTIANFRKDYGEPLRQVCREFVDLCRRLELFTSDEVAIDGSKFKAVNNRDRNFTQAKVKRRLEQIHKSIDRYLSQLESADRAEPELREMKKARLQDKIETLEKQIEQLNELETQRQAAPDQQISLTDPDARSMATSGKGTGMVGYNVQIAVETDHHLIVAHEVTNDGHDRHQLAPMAAQAKTALDTDDLTAVADRGYYEGEQIVTCENTGTEVYVPKPLTSPSKAAGRFGKQDFQYDAEHNQYRCPAGEVLSYHYTSVEDDKALYVYWGSACGDCPLKAKCTTGKERRIKRWEHEDVLDAMQVRLEHNPQMMALRRQTVEHPFGTLKAWMGATHFLTKRLPKVSTEMSLHVLAYNFKRVMNILGVGAFIEAVAG
jgi:transposase